MAVHTIRKGLDLPIAGDPERVIDEGAAVSRVALIADDYVGMKPTMFVRAGDKVLRGQALFEDKKNAGVIYTSPGAGTVVGVNRGAKRALQSVVIELNAREVKNQPTKRELQEFESYTGDDPAGLSADQIRDLLVESGMWTAFRTRPMSKVPVPDATPKAIFVTAMDTNPLAPPVDLIYGHRDNAQAFQTGMLCIAKLHEGPTYLCRAPGSAVSPPEHTTIRVEEFAGAHPAGTAGVHIHVLEGAGREWVVWHIGYQDVMAIGRLFLEGRLDVRRIVGIGGPQVKSPRLLTTRVGAWLDELLADEVVEADNRVISGSVLSGRKAMGEELGYLGRYHNQVSVIREGRERIFLGWMTPGAEKFSVLNVFASNLMPSKKFTFTTTTNGSERAMVPIGTYERVMPMDIMATELLRRLIVGDVERAEQLGCLELDEEDLALCTFVCPGKYDYGPYLRDVLTQIEREG